MNKKYYIEKTNELLKEVFGKKFLKHTKTSFKEPKKAGDISIYACRNLVISDGHGIYTIFQGNSWKELYGYACGLYDMKKGKVKDTIKFVKDMEKLHEQ